MKNKSVCIVGVDGAGKSSTIEKLVKRLGETNSCVQYMGSRQWETQLARNNVEKQIHRFPVRAIMFVYSYIYEMYYRVLKHRKSKKIVIFDRYAYEQVYIREASTRGLRDKLNNFIFRVFLLWFFPRPDITFYLVCPLEVSMKRKTDIITQDDIDSLVRNKECLDRCYLNKKGVYVIDTSVVEQSDVVNIIEKTIKERLT